jgi:hypothetical protein
MKTVANMQTEAIADTKQWMTLSKDKARHFVPYKCCYLTRIEANFVLG